MRKLSFALASVFVLLSAASFAADAPVAGDAAHGEKLYASRCTACHALDVNKIGPKSRGVYGRKAGSLEGFVFSPALKASGIVWDDAKLDQWLTFPGGLVPGVKMTLKTFDPKDRADIVAYLKSLSAADAAPKK